MHPLTFRSALALVLLLIFAFTSAEAAVPKAGRYKGTITLRTVVDGTKAEVKQVYPVAGILAQGSLLLVIPEVPDLLNFFTSRLFNSEVSDGAVTLRPNDNTVPITLTHVKTLTTTIRGDVELVGLAPPTGSGSASVFLDLAVTRVGN